MPDLNQSVKASIEAHARSMEGLHSFAPCPTHPGCCVIAAGPYIDNGLIPQDRSHVVDGFNDSYEAAEKAARTVVRHYATGNMKQEYRSGAAS